VPFFGLVMPFVLGAKGNEWAWRNGRWQTVEQFQRTQRRWAQYGLAAYAGITVIAVVLVLVVTTLMKHTMAFELAQSQISKDPRVVQLLGSPLDMGMVRGSIATSAGAGTANISFPVEGPKGAGQAYVSASSRADRWTLTYLEVAFESGMRIPIVGELREPESTHESAFDATSERKPASARQNTQATSAHRNTRPNANAHPHSWLGSEPCLDCTGA
jgi:hypothetical protein